MKYSIQYTKPFIGTFNAIPGLKPYVLTSPVTEEPLASISGNQADHIDTAVAVSREALVSWGSWTGAQRRIAMTRISDLMKTNKDELAYLESLGGKPIKQALGDIEASIECMRFFAGHAEAIHGKYMAFNPQFQSFTIKEPIGVCGLISSFNYPLLLAIWKVAPALAAGNTVIIKPAIQTPLSTLLFAKLVSEAELPSGVFNVVLGGAEVGEAIAKHPGIDMISFTGSTNVGRLVASASALAGPRPCILELGGKNAIIVFQDANLEKAADSIVVGAFANMGQNCCAGSRLLVHSSVYDRVIALVKERVEKLVVGDPFDEATDLGPVIDKGQFDKVMRYIQIAKDTNLRCLSGGKRVGDRGYFVQPTVYTQVNDDSPLAKEEIFGPVLAILTSFDTIEEAIQRANASEYGLACGVFTSDLGKFQLCAKKIKAGMIWVNHYDDYPHYMPFGGLKHSGYGKDLGVESLDAFTVIKSVHAMI